MRLVRGGLIRIGDTTSGGGHVITARGTNVIVSDKGIALAGDKATCEKHGGVQIFVECCQGNNCDGIGWVIEGCKLSCGCIAYSSCADLFMAEDVVGAAPHVSAASQLSPWLAGACETAVESFDQQFQILDSTGKPVPNAKYKIVAASGETKTGITDAKGRATRIFSVASEDLDIYWVS